MPRDPSGACFVLFSAIRPGFVIDSNLIFHVISYSLDLISNEYHLLLLFTIACTTAYRVFCSKNDLRRAEANDQASSFLNPILPVRGLIHIDVLEHLIRLVAHFI